MGWRFRKSFKVIPGVKLNLSRSGLSVSVGGAPITVNIGPRGVYGTASLPGTGISFRQKLQNDVERPRADDHSTLPHPVELDSIPSLVPSLPLPSPISLRLPPIEEIRSASTELLTSGSLQVLKRLIQTAYEEHTDIECELATARQEAGPALARYLSWENGFLFKKVFKETFAVRKTESETANAKVQELEEQLRETTIATHLEISHEQAEPYFQMRDEFAKLAECAAIWDKKSRQATNRVRERTIAFERIARERVVFSLGSCDLINWEQTVPHLQNVTGGDMFLYPGFVLYRTARQAFSVIDFHDVKLSSTLVRFVEEGTVPTDSRIVGQTWAKANNDGSPDRRFANNYQIPIAQYGELVFKSETGLWEEYQFSDPERMERLVKAWNAFLASFQDRPTMATAGVSASIPNVESDGLQPETDQMMQELAVLFVSIEKPLQEQLTELSEGKPDVLTARDCFVEDLFGLTVYFSIVDHRVTEKGAQISWQILGHLAPSTYGTLTPTSMAQLMSSMIQKSPERYSAAPQRSSFLTFTLLARSDGIYGTDYAHKVRESFCRFAALIVKSVGNKPVGEEPQLHRLEEILKIKEPMKRENAQPPATLACEEELLALIAGLKLAIEDIKTPLRPVLKEVDDSALEGNAPEICILSGIMVIMDHFASTRAEVSDNLIEIYRKILGSLDPEHYGELFQLTAKKLIIEGKRAHSDARDKPFSIKLLELFDSASGTAHAHTMTVQFLHLARTIAAADGPISEQQQAALEHFELQLSIPGPLPSATPS